jgi:hypothetical protein
MLDYLKNSSISNLEKKGHEMLSTTQAFTLKLI